MSLQARTFVGVIWSFFEQLLRRGVSILVTLLLARFLVPEDFGLLAMMTVFITIATALMDSGIKSAVIRKLEPDECYFSTAFYTNLGLGLLSYSLLFIVAPFIAEFYEESRLTLLIRVAGIAVLINAFQVIQVAMLSRELNFKLQMKATVPAGVVSGLVAILLAYLGFGVWALVVQTLLSALLVVIVYWWVQPWRPRLVFDVMAMKEMYNFGYKLFLSGFLSSFSNNIYILVIAKVFTTGVAGLYFFAERIKSLLISQLVLSVQKATYPALSTLQDDKGKLKKGYRNVMRVTTFMLFPAMLLLAALAKPLFEFLFPDRWLPAVAYLQLMCIVGLLYPVHSINLNILKVKGRSDLVLWLEVYKKATLFMILFVSYRYGVIGIIVGQGIQSILAYLPNSYFSNKLIGYTVKEQLQDIAPGLAIAATVSLLVFWLHTLVTGHPLLVLSIFSALGSLMYILMAKFLKLPAYQLAQGMIQGRLNNRVKHA